MTATLTEQALRLNRGGPLPPLLLFTDETRQPDPAPLLRRLKPGCGVVFRHYGDPQRATIGQRLRALARAQRLVFLVAADVRLAAALRADGLHLPEGLSCCPSRALSYVRARGGLLTTAAHSRATLARAARFAHGATLSPVFATASHPGAPSLGALGFRRLAGRARLPVIALGGIKANNLTRLRGRAASIATVGNL